jgi:hypothetical protein
MAARVLALTLLVLALAACGSNDAHKSQSNAARAAAQWSGGLRHWGSRITDAIDGISLLFSQPSSVRGIQAGNLRIGAMLAKYERTLAACSARVERLGTPPASLVLAKREALHACISLERAAVLIRKGIAAFQHGLGPELLNGTGDPLTAGEDGIRRALLDLEEG